MCWKGDPGPKGFNAPMNCAECFYTGTCTAPHYGGNRCRYEGTIKTSTIEKILKEAQNDSENLS